jgi:hypothetical protein
MVESTDSGNVGAIQWKILPLLTLTNEQLMPLNNDSIPRIYVSNTAGVETPLVE